MNPAHSLRDAHSPRLALRATGLLACFNTAGIVSAADLHVAARLGLLGREPDERVQLAVALATRAARSGSVCLELGEAAGLGPEHADGEDHADDDGAAQLPWPDLAAWRGAIGASPLVAVGPDGPADRPVRLVEDRLYLDRYWRDEELIRAEVRRRRSLTLTGSPEFGDGVVAAAEAAARRLFPAERDDRQREAAVELARSRLTILTGGPGTGKTTTVARLLAVAHETLGPGLRVALAAPTGKAAARLTEAVRAELVRLDASDRGRVGEPAATTVHRLLGWKPGSTTRFRHDRTRRLPHDLVVVDETSMMSLPLIARLLEAMRPDARLLLVGDPDQLASVEAGAVLGDLVAGLSDGVVRLERVHRHGDAIAELARAIRENRADDVIDLLRGGDGLELLEVPDGASDVPDTLLQALRSDAVRAGVELVSAARDGDAARALRALDAHRLLLAHRRGPFGALPWADRVAEWVAAAADHDGVPRPGPGGSTPGGSSPWYPGRPVIVTTNDRATGLANGDTGVLVADGSGGLVAVFGDPSAPVRVRPHRLPPVESVHALTVHRAQGSQFERVSLILPPTTSPLLTRELLYTAVTRAQRAVRVVASADAVRAAVGRPIRRASGLRTL